MIRVTVDSCHRIFITLLNSASVIVVPAMFAVIALVIVSVFFMVSSIVVMVPVIVIVLVKVWAGVMVVVILVLVVVWLRIGLRRLWLRVRRRRLRSGRWAGVWLRWRNSPGQIKKAPTAAALAAIRQGNGDAPLDVRATGCQRQKKEKVFHLINSERIAAKETTVTVMKEKTTKNTETLGLGTSHM